MSARIGAPSRFVPNVYVDVGGTGAGFPFSDEVSYFTEMALRLTPQAIYYRFRNMRNGGDDHASSDA